MHRHWNKLPECRTEWRTEILGFQKRHREWTQWVFRQKRELDLLVTARLIAKCLSVSISWKQSNPSPEIKKKRKIIGRPAIPNRHILTGTPRKN